MDAQAAGMTVGFTFDAGCTLADFPPFSQVKKWDNMVDLVKGQVLTPTLTL